MGVKGAGLRADGLHKAHINGSPEDHNSAAARTRTGGSNTDLNNRFGLNKQFSNQLPAETGTPGRSPYTITGAKTPMKINSAKKGG